MGTKSICFIILFSIFTFLQNAIAASWKLVGIGMQGNVFYLDKSSVNTTYAAIPETTFWVKVLHKDKQTYNSQSIWYELDRMGVNCNSKQIFTPFQGTVYSVKGLVLTSFNTYESPEAVVPESVGEAIFNEVCSSVGE